MFDELTVLFWFDDTFVKIFTFDVESAEKLPEIFTFDVKFAETLPELFTFDVKFE